MLGSNWGWWRLLGFVTHQRGYVGNYEQFDLNSMWISFLHKTKYQGVPVYNFGFKFLISFSRYILWKLLTCEEMKLKSNGNKGSRHLHGFLEWRVLNKLYRYELVLIHRYFRPTSSSCILSLLWSEVYTLILFSNLTSVLYMYTDSISDILVKAKDLFMIRREICPKRAEISTHKHGEKLYISDLYD